LQLYLVLAWQAELTDLDLDLRMIVISLAFSAAGFVKTIYDIVHNAQDCDMSIVKYLSLVMQLGFGVPAAHKVEELKAGGCPLYEVRQAGYSIEDCKGIYKLPDAMLAQNKWPEPSDLWDMQIRTACEWKDCGYTAQHCKDSKLFAPSELFPFCARMYGGHRSLGKSVIAEGKFGHVSQVDQRPEYSDHIQIQYEDGTMNTPSNPNRTGPGAGFLYPDVLPVYYVQWGKRKVQGWWINGQPNWLTGRHILVFTAKQQKQLKATLCPRASVQPECGQE
jgi:hypothetical protein